VWQKLQTFETMLAVLFILFFSLWLFFYTFILHGSLHGALHGSLHGSLLGDLLGNLRGSFWAKGDDALENITIIHRGDAKDAEINFLMAFR
jgi:hypothetical protein